MIPAIITWGRQRDLPEYAELIIWRNLVNTYDIQQHFHITDKGDVPRVGYEIAVPDLETALQRVRARSDYVIDFVNIRPAERFKQEGVKFLFADDYSGFPPYSCFVFGPNIGEAPLVSPAWNMAIWTGDKYLHAVSAASIIFQYHIYWGAR